MNDRGVTITVGGEAIEHESLSYAIDSGLTIKSAGEEIRVSDCGRISWYSESFKAGYVATKEQTRLVYEALKKVYDND